MQNSDKTLEPQPQEEIFLASCCAEVLRQGMRVIEEIGDDLYRSTEGFGEASVGSHFRHILDFAVNLLNGLDRGRIDYNRRARDVRIERSRRAAAALLAAVIERLENFPADFAGTTVLVSLETKLGNRAEEDEYCASSVLRELDFLQSHTIHHYALIAAKLAAGGYRVAANFGVAPSTLEYWKKTKGPAAVGAAE